MRVLPYIHGIGYWGKISIYNSQITQMQLLAFLITFFLFTSATTATITDNSTFTTTLVASLLSATGFKQLSDVVASVGLSTTAQLTIFAPSDSSFLTCPSCSFPGLLLKRLTVPGLYPFRSLRTLAFGTKIETLAPNYCLTITISTNSGAPHELSKTVLVNGIEITHPDLFDNGIVVVHGLQGFVPDFSPVSCNVEPRISLSFPQLQPSKSAPSSIMRLMLKDAILRLRFIGFNILAIALRVKYGELSELRCMTVFALHDFSILSSGGHIYLSNFRFHVVPNMLLTAQELIKLPRGAVFTTMEAGQKLVVTVASRGGGSPSSATMKINYVKLTNLDLIQNSRIVVHAVSTPFPQVNHQIPEEEEKTPLEQTQRMFGCDFLLEKDAIKRQAWPS